ncbi:hypothetical protein C3R44_21805, partial [Mycobacterium tuberculosis]
MRHGGGETRAGARGWPRRPEGGEEGGDADGPGAGEDQQGEHSPGRGGARGHRGAGERQRQGAKQAEGEPRRHGRA